MGMESRKPGLLSWVAFLQGVLSVIIEILLSVAPGVILMSLLFFYQGRSVLFSAAPASYPQADNHLMLPLVQVVLLSLSPPPSSSSGPVSRSSSSSIRSANKDPGAAEKEEAVLTPLFQEWWRLYRERLRASSVINSGTQEARSTLCSRRVL